MSERSHDHAAGNEGDIMIALRHCRRVPDMCPECCKTTLILEGQWGHNAHVRVHAMHHAPTKHLACIIACQSSLSLAPSSPASRAFPLPMRARVLLCGKGRGCSHARPTRGPFADFRRGERICTNCGFVLERVVCQHFRIDARTSEPEHAVGKENDAVASVLIATPDVEKIDMIKARLPQLRSRHEELTEVVERARADFEAEDKRASEVRAETFVRDVAERDAIIKHALCAWDDAAAEHHALQRDEASQVTAEERDAAAAAMERATAERDTTIEGAWAKHKAVIERATAEYEGEMDRVRAARDVLIAHAWVERRDVHTELSLLERELDALVNAPVSGGRDPTEWLPDELIVMIMLMLSLDALWGGVCQRVCQRWARLMESAPIKRRKGDKWAAYNAGFAKPRELKGHDGSVYALAVGLDGKLYSGSVDKTIRVWSSDGVHLQTLEGHTETVWTLAVGTNGKVYSGSGDNTVRVWCGDDGTHLQTLKGHIDVVTSLAEGLDGKVYSGSGDCTIRVWSADDGAHLDTLDGHARAIMALVVGLDGKVYSGSKDATIRVWSGANGKHLQVLRGHANDVVALTVGMDGKIYSASKDATIRVWSGEDGTHLQVFSNSASPFRPLPAWHAHDSLTVGLNGMLYSGSNGVITVRSCVDGTCVHKLTGHTSYIRRIVFGRDGTSMFSCGFATGPPHTGMPRTADVMSPGTRYAVAPNAGSATGGFPTHGSAKALLMW
jgi:WD40 repeat protein